MTVTRMLSISAWSLTFIPTIVVLLYFYSNYSGFTITNINTFLILAEISELGSLRELFIKQTSDLNTSIYYN